MSLPSALFFVCPDFFFLFFYFLGETSRHEAKKSRGAFSVSPFCAASADAIFVARGLPKRNTSANK
jgi:hypothetical protein